MKLSRPGILTRAMPWHPSSRFSPISLFGRPSTWGKPGRDENSWGYAGRLMDTAEIRCQSPKNGGFISLILAMPIGSSPPRVPLTKTS